MTTNERRLEPPPTPTAAATHDRTTGSTATAASRQKGTSSGRRSRYLRPDADGRLHGGGSHLLHGVRALDRLDRRHPSNDDVGNDTGDDNRNRRHDDSGHSDHSDHGDDCQHDCSGIGPVELIRHLQRDQLTTGARAW